MSATDALSQTTTVATNIWQTVWAASGDFLAIIIIATALFLLAWYAGRATLVAIIFAFYAASAVYVTFPYMSLIAKGPSTDVLFVHMGVFFVLVIFFYIILRRMITSDFLSTGLAGTLILSVLGATFLIALGYHLFPVAVVYDFSDAIDTLFAQKQFFFWWFSFPAIGLFFLAR